MSIGTALHCIVSSAVAGLRPVGRAMSASGQKQTSEHVWAMSALPPKADIDEGDS